MGLDSLQILHPKYFMLREGAKNTLKGGCAESRGLRPQVGPPPTFGCERLYPSISAARHLYHPSFELQSLHPPHMEKVCMRFTTCITPKWLEIIKTDKYKYIIMLYIVV